jgi:4-amino-4-deoxy-L-arabinose transferase-like glycosyltransferase
MGSGRIRMRDLYLALALAGGILPWLANLEFMQTYGASFDLGLFVRLANANPAAASLSRDLAVGAAAVTIWMVSESKRLGMRGLTWVLLSCVTIAFAFGCPLFLYLRERRLDELQRQGPGHGGDQPQTIGSA